jgi:hypothetical protein
MTLTEVVQGLVRDEAYAAGGDGADGVIHHRQRQALQVGKVTGDIEDDPLLQRAEAAVAEASRLR